MRNRWLMLPALVLVGGLGACAGEPEHGSGSAERVAVEGGSWTVRDTILSAVFDAAGVARPVAEATLSTKLMGEVREVAVREGDRVSAGQPLVRIDAADLEAKEAQVEASIREAEAMVADAETQTARMRALYEDDAAPEAQLDAAETGLERARARLAAARAGAAEVEATARYATVRAPFDGIVTARRVDAGDFAAPGTPMVTVLDGGRLRVTVTASPAAVAGIGRGDTLRAWIEGDPAVATVEGVVPDGAGTVYSVNAIVENGDGRFLPGSAATLALPQGERRAVVIPSSAVIRRGDLTGVRVRTGDATPLRWIRLGDRLDGLVEVLAGLAPGDVIVMPPSGAVADEGGAG